jgi:PAT family beta-lactamase induction signal transducer AmpG
VLSVLNAWFAGLPPESFAHAFEKSGVSPASLASGYAIFFIYSCLVGLAALALAVVVARDSREQNATPVTDTGAPVRPFGRQHEAPDRSG